METFRYAWGTRSNRWHLIDETDRDYKVAITSEEILKYGWEACKEIYLNRF